MRVVEVDGAVILCQQDDMKPLRRFTVSVDFLGESESEKEWGNKGVRE
jgi:hypothetical protein